MKKMLIGATLFAAVFGATTFGLRVEVGQPAVAQEAAPAEAPAAAPQGATITVVTPAATPAEGTEDPIFSLSLEGKEIRIRRTAEDVNGTLVSEAQLSELCRGAVMALTEDNQPELRMAVKDGIFKVGTVDHEETLQVSCPVVVDPEDQAAYDFALRHFTDRLHDTHFFTEADRDQGMLPAIADRMYLTGPEFFDGFTVHAHDGVAIDDVFTDARANVMAYRFISEDGQRAYLMIPTSFCTTTCSGADYIFLHASKGGKTTTTRRVVVTHEHKTETSRPAPDGIEMICSPNC